MNRQDQQAIDELFQRLYQTTEQGGPRDSQAEARIQQHFQKGPPGLLYHMAQTLVAQQYALQQAKAELADRRRQGGGAPAGFGPPGPQQAGRGGYGGYQQGYQQPPYPQYQQGYQQQAPSGSGFLAGAGRIALGVGGGILGAELLSGMFGGGGLFGDRDVYVDDRDVYVDDRDDYGDRGSGDQDYGGQDDYGDGQDYGDGGFDGGDFGGGDFGGDQGGW